MRRWLPAIAYDHPVTVFMGFVALLVVGVIAASRIPLQMMPSGFEPRFLQVWVPWQDATPLESDEQLVRPIEAQLSTVPGINTITSRANANGAQISIEFYSSVEMDEAYNVVVDRLERSMVDLPEEVDRYWIWKFNPDSQPVMFIGVSLPDDMEDPYHVLDRVVQPRIARIPGVATADVWGVPQRAVFIDYDREKVVAHSIDLGSVQRRLATDNFQMAGGRVTDRGQVRHVRSLARIDDVETLQRYPVRDDLVLEDIADVRLRGAMSTSINRLNGERAAVMVVRKESSANTVQVTQAVQEAFDELNGSERVEGAGFYTFFSQGELVQASVTNLAWTAVTGGIFAVIILFMFLREWRMTLLISASIPFSLLITMAILYFRGDTLNLLSLMGLMLAVGMVVDNAIVVVEAIYRRRAEGAGIRAAAVEGSAEVNLAILTSTLTTMVVFLPLILMSEDAGFSFFMGVLGFPVVFALLASLLVALVFAPLATRYMGAAQVKADARWLAWLTDKYVAVLRWTLGMRKGRWRTPAAWFDTGAVLLAILFLTIIPFRGTECTGDGDGNINDFTVRFTVPPQADYYERDAIVKRFESVLEEHSEEWGIKVYYAELESDDLDGEMQVFLKTDGPMARDEVMAAAKEALPRDMPGVVPSVGWDSGGGGGGQRITLSILGEDMKTLAALGDEVVRRVETVDGVMAARRDVVNEGADEIQLRLDRDALAQAGLNAATVGQTVAYYLRGNELDPIVSGEREIDVVTRFELDDRDDLEAVMDSPIWSNSHQRLLPLRALATVEVGKGPMSIRRTNRRTGIQVSVDLEEDVPMDRVFGSVNAALADMELPRGYTWEHGQQFDQRVEDDEARNFAMLLSVAFVFLLMAILFEDLLKPLAIIATVPMAMVGVFWLLWITGTAFDVMAGIGLVILVGVVVNNGIVLVDLVGQLRAQGMDREEALVEAGRRRFRPILMTAMTTIFGLLPMAWGSSGFIGISYGPLGRTVMGGLAASTVLTLLFVPFLYAVFDEWWLRAKGWVSFVVRGRHAA